MKSWLLIFNPLSITLVGTRRFYLGTAWVASLSFGLFNAVE